MGRSHIWLPPISLSPLFQPISKFHQLDNQVFLNLFCFLCHVLRYISIIFALTTEIAFPPVSPISSATHNSCSPHFSQEGFCFVFLLKNLLLAPKVLLQRLPYLNWPRSPCRTATDPSPFSLTPVLPLPHLSWVSYMLCSAVLPHPIFTCSVPPP